MEIETELTFWRISVMTTPGAPEFRPDRLNGAEASLLVCPISATKFNDLSSSKSKSDLLAEAVARCIGTSQRRSPQCTLIPTCLESLCLCKPWPEPAHRLFSVRVVRTCEISNLSVDKIAACSKVPIDRWTFSVSSLTCKGFTWSMLIKAMRRSPHPHLKAFQVSLLEPVASHARIVRLRFSPIVKMDILRPRLVCHVGPLVCVESRRIFEAILLHV